MQEILSIGSLYMKKILINIFIIFILFSCSNKKYPEYYYILFSFLRNGLNQPEKVKNIQIQFRSEILSLEITWDPSRDPDTNLYVPYYFIYVYFEYPSKDMFYDKKYLLDIVNDTKYVFFVQDFRGILYFMITAYDLGSESQPSDIIEFKVPQ